MEFLRKNFEYIALEEAWRSKKKHLGVSTGDDKSLWINSDDRSTIIFWKDNRGFETTIFDGKSLKTEEEFNTIFDFLEIEKYIRWK